MATHTYLYDRQSEIIFSRKNVLMTRHALRIETEHEGNGRVPSENAHVWHETLTSLTALRGELNTLITELETALKNTKPA